MIKERKIAIIGLGYVGLPLAAEFAKSSKVLAFDIDKERINELTTFRDRTNEVPTRLLKDKKLKFTTNISDISECNFYVITVPTPVDKSLSPDLRPLKSASRSIASVLKRGDIVVYESTVFPGATEEVCVPILEKYSNLKFIKDFNVGYSPERINPGDEKHRVHNIVKIVSASNPKTLDIVDDVYKKIVKAGTHRTTSIKVAEAAKVIENTQRDLNIAFINELSIIFNKMDIDTEEVLQAAETKWNFLSFRPGMVGGHCIGVDPYYLTYKAEDLGYKPKIILSGRKLNDEMPKYLGKKLITEIKRRKMKFSNTRILILGVTFKENTPDTRNTKVIDFVKYLKQKNLKVDIFDPNVPSKRNNKIKTISNPKKTTYDVIVLAVAHKEFKEMGLSNIRSFGKTDFILFDLKYMFKKSKSDLRI